MSGGGKGGNGGGTYAWTLLRYVTQNISGPLKSPYNPLLGTLSVSPYMSSYPWSLLREEEEEGVPFKGP